ncbi:MAG: metal-dependent hydrolase, partial [Clostridia bacterium]|nr:metal-dependent hydrolase [Clostridia bacterium]
GGLAAVAGNDTKVLSVVETANYLAQKGFDAVGLNFGGEATVGGVKFAVTQAIHTNSTTENGKAVYGGLACGFVLAADGKSVYFAGDTDVFSDMALIKEFYSPDIAILPVGGWYTMDVKKAVYACNRLLKPKYLIPMHFDTFPAIKADLSPLSCDLETAKAIILKDGDSADF